MVPGIIPPQLWEWATGGNCCEDCWAKHRNLGLDCLVDTVCCAGTCGIQPGCNGGGGGGVGDGPDGGGGGDGESCGATRDVHDATIQYNGQTCSFDGKVHPTWVDGKCVNVAGEGVIYACDGVDGFVFEDPTETETPGP